MWSADGARSPELMLLLYNAVQQLQYARHIERLSAECISSALMRFSQECARRELRCQQVLVPFAALVVTPHRVDTRSRRMVHELVLVQPTGDMAF